MLRTNSARGKPRPSSLYAFVVVALAAFLAMFVVWRSPGITYRVQAELVASDGERVEGADDSEKLTSQAMKEFLDTRFILAALRAAELVGGETSPAAQEIAHHLGRRLYVRLGETDEAKSRIQLAVETRNPHAAARLLDAMTTRSEAVIKKAMLPVPAGVVSQRGGSITHGQLAVLAMMSSVFGFAAVWLAERAGPTPILYTGHDVLEATGLPVLVNLAGGEGLPVPHPADYRRRCFRLLLTTAEAGIAAVFLLVVFHLATQEAFPSRFRADPLAACGEALTRLI